MGHLTRTTGTVLLIAALSLSSCNRPKMPEAVIGTLGQATAIALYKGLPHQNMEQAEYEAERRSNAVVELDGYSFYEKKPALSEEDSLELIKLLGEPGTFRPFSGEKSCGGFHPDFAAEWTANGNIYRALICFGCHEIILSGAGQETRFDLDSTAYDRLESLLGRHRLPRSATKTLKQAMGLVLYEGLPHQHFERAQLESEKRSKAVIELDGFSLYEKKPVLSESDAADLANLLSEPDTYQFFSGEKKCGGFHPDYAVEWTANGNTYRALLCFGCGEVILAGMGKQKRFDLDSKVYEQLKKLLTPYQQSRPPPSR